MTPGGLTWITDAVVGPAAHVAADRPAVALDDGAPLTWGELRVAELQTARALRAAGVRQGDRVGMLMRNSVDYIVVYLALARLGAVSVRLNFRLTAGELGYILTDSGASTVVFDDDFAETVTGLRTDSEPMEFVSRPTGSGAPVPAWAQDLRILRASTSGAEPDAAEFPRPALDDPASLLYTSGTTGRPKGAVWTHGGSLWFATIQALKWNFDSTSVHLTPGPLFHGGGLEALLLPALVQHGTAVTLSSGGFTVERLLEVARAQGVTMLLLYSFMAYEALQRPTFRDEVPATVRRIVCGGDTLMPWVYREFERLLPGVEIIQQYGLTEGGAVSTCLDHADAAGREGSVGRPMPLTEVRVVAQDGTPAPAGDVGEVWVRSPAVSPGYWENPAATAATFHDGWCATGDLGRLDEAGFLTLAGRAKDMIRSGGENVYPAEVESVLTDFDGVADAAVIGVPDERYTEVGHAILVPAADAVLDMDRLRDFAAGRLAKYKIPRHFTVVDELPRTPAGKVKKYELRRTFSAAPQ